MRRFEAFEPSQLRVLQLTANGHDLRGLQRATGWNVSVLKEELRRARHRLEARNTTHAVTLAYRAGLIA